LIDSDTPGKAGAKAKDWGSTLTVPGIAAINRWRAEGARLARQSQQLRLALARTTATAADEHVQLRVAASGVLLAVGFTEASRQLSQPQLSAAVLRVYAAAKALLISGDGLEDGRNRPIRVALAPEDDDPAFTTAMTAIASPAGVGLPTAADHAEMIQRIRRLNQTGPDGLGLRSVDPPPGQDYDDWMHQRLTRIAEQATRAARRVNEVVGRSTGDYLTIEVDHSAAPIAVRFLMASARLGPEQLGTEFAKSYTEAAADARAQAAAIRAESK